MFLHIGGSQIVFNRELIGIFNLDLTEKSVNKQFLDFATGKLSKAPIGSDHPRSFVVTDHRVYISPISPLTLSRRRNSRVSP